MGIRQTTLYAHRVTVWRRQGSTASYTQVTGLTALACYVETQSSRPEAQALVQAATTELVPKDLLHCASGTALVDGDYIKMTTGPHVGSWWQVRGPGKVRTRRAGKMQLEVQPEDQKPPGAS